MSPLTHDIGTANRLTTIAERIGFSLWQLQTLEGTTAQYYVLIAQASPGMGMEAAEELLDDARSKTFGKTVTRLQKSGHVPDELMARFQALLNERNWLVHNSRTTSASAVHDDAECAQLIERVDAITDEAQALLKEVTKLTEAFLLSKGFSPRDIKTAERMAYQQVYGRDHDS